MNVTMTSDEVLDLIESVAKTSGKNDKLAMLKACASSELLKRVLKACYDPTVSYGIKKVPARTCHSPEGAQLNDRAWGVLAGMADRTITGNAMLADVEVVLNQLSAKSADLFKRILLKDMRAGFSEETTNKVWPGLVPDFPYMRCCLPKDGKPEGWDWTNGHISQEKADGLFANVDHEATGEVFIYTRQGSMFPMEKFAALAEEIKLVFNRGSQSHGEILVKRDGVVLARETGNGIVNSVIKGGDFGPNDEPVFMVWDQIPLSAVKPKGKHDVPYIMRLRELMGQLKRCINGTVKLVPTKVVKSLAEAYAHYAELLAQGKEGTILKKSSAIWKDGTSKDQVKLKLEFVVDLVITAIVPGKENGKNAGRPGSVTGATADGQLVTDVTVKNEAMRAEIEKDPNAFIGKILKVMANGVMKPSPSSPVHSLFLPRMVEACVRVDKSTADTLAQVFAQEEAAKMGAAILAEAA